MGFLFLVLDPDSSDPTFGDAITSVLRPEMCQAEIGTMLGASDALDVGVYDLIEEIRKLLKSADHTGCTPDLVVVKSEPVHNLKRMLAVIGELK